MSVRSESWSRRAEAGTLALALAIGLGLLGASWAALHLPPLDRDQIVDTPVYQEYGEAIAAGEVPYRDFEVEYPPAALPVFWLPTLAPEEHYRTAFELVMLACAAAALALVLAALVALGAPPGRLLAAAVLVGLFPLALGTVVLTRYDLWPAALVAGALAALLAGRSRLALAVLALAAAAKIYPLVLLPPALLFVARRRGTREAIACLALFALVLGLVVAPFAALGPGGLLDSVERQLGRPLQIESLGAALLLAGEQLGVYEATVVSTHGSQNLAGPLPDALATVQTVLQAGALLVVWALAARGPLTPARLAAASAASVVAFVAFGKVLSPQFLVWLVPLVPLVAGRAGAAAGALLAGALVATQLWFPQRYWDVVALEWEAWLVLARNLLLVALAAVLAVACARPRRGSAAPRSP
ncbi:MAG TPA: glycosyltransferase 87 family protein [Gaiellaceae bacterium]|nr:glycosyltransferase 87 family protein [Gaiellaceae bacterium]